MVSSLNWIRFDQTYLYELLKLQNPKQLKSETSRTVILSPTVSVLCLLYGSLDVHSHCAHPHVSSASILWKVLNLNSPILSAANISPTTRCFSSPSSWDWLQFACQHERFLNFAKTEHRCKKTSKSTKEERKRLSLAKKKKERERERETVIVTATKRRKRAQSYPKICIWVEKEVFFQWNF